MAELEQEALYDKVYNKSKAGANYLGADGYFGTCHKGGPDRWYEFIKQLYDLAGKPMVDRQFLLPFGTSGEIVRAVEHMAGTSFLKDRSGVIAQCEWGNDVPIENVSAFYEVWGRI